MWDQARTLYEESRGLDRVLLYACLVFNVYLVFNPYIQATLRQMLYILVERLTLSSYQKSLGFFRRIEEITPEWIESQLQYGTLVDEITVKKMGDDMGMCISFAASFAPMSNFSLARIVQATPR